MKIRSQTYPTTNRVPMGRSLVHVSSDKISFENSGKYLKPSGGHSDFTLVGSSGVVNRPEDGAIFFQEAGSEIYELSKQLTSLTDVLVYRLKAGLYSGSPIAVGQSFDFFKVSVYDLATSDVVDFILRVVNDPVEGMLLNIVAETQINGVPDTYEFDAPDVDAWAVELFLRVDGSGLVGLGVGDDSFAFNFSQAFTQGVVQVSYYGRTNDIVFSWPVGEIPAIEGRGIIDNEYAGLPVPIRNGPGYFVYAVEPPYPGEFEVRMSPTSGEDWTVELYSSVKAEDCYIYEDNFKLLVSPAEEYDVYYGETLYCPTAAKQLNEDTGEVYVPVECIDEPIESDASEVRLRIQDSGDLHTSGGNSFSKSKPSFVVERDGEAFDGRTAVYGEDFDFKKMFGINATANNMVVPGKKLVSPRGLQLSNGNHIYYGVNTPGTTADPNVYLEIEDSGPNPYYEFRNEETGEVLKAGIPYDFVDASFPPGYYSLSLRDAHIGENQIANIFFSNGIFNISRYDVSVDEPLVDGRGNLNSNEDKHRVHKFFFELKKDFLGTPVIYPNLRNLSNILPPYEGPEEDVWLGTDSFACVETLDGNVAFIYQRYAGATPFQNELREFMHMPKLHYRVFDLSTYTWGDEYGIFFPELSEFEGDEALIHSFDAVRAEDEIHFFFSIEKRGNAIVSPDLSRDVIHQAVPLTEGSDITHFNFQGDKAVVGEYRPLNAAQDLEKIYSWGVRESVYYTPLGGGALVEENFEYVMEEEFLASDLHLPFRGGGFRKINVNYDKDFSSFSVALLNERSLAPIVLSGNPGSWRRIGVPLFFDFYSGGRFNIGHSEMKYTNIHSLSAVRGNDGATYVIAMKDKYNVSNPSYQETYCEIAVLDSDKDSPAVIEHGLGTYDYMPFDNIEAEEHGGNPLMYSKYEVNPLSFDFGRFVFTSTPVFNILEDGYESSGTLSVLDGYLFAIISRPYAYGSVPYIYYSMNQDVCPFGAPLYEVFEAGVNPNNAYEIMGDYHISDNSVQMVNTLSTVEYRGPYIKRRLPVKFNQRSLEGATFRYNLSYTLQKTSAGDFISNPFIFETQVGIPVYEFPVRVIFNGSQAKVMVWQSGSFAEVGSVCGLDTPTDMYKYSVDIFIKPSEYFQTYQVAVVFKKVQSGYFYDFRGEKGQVVFGSGTRRAPVENGGDNYMVVYFDSDSQVFEVLNVHQMGFGVSPINGVASENLLVGDSFANGLVATEDVATGRRIEFEGDRWRNFSDGHIFRYSDGNPALPFRIAEANKSNKSSATYHYPNGFKFKFTGDRLSTADSFSIQRHKDGAYENIQPNILHGNFSAPEGNDVIISLNATTLGVPRISADAFVWTGTNVPYVEIVARDSEEDPWEVIEVVSNRVFEMAPNDYEVINPSKSRVKFKEAEVNLGRFSEYEYYFESGGRAALIKSSSRDSIYCKNEWSLPEGNDASIFVDRGSVILESPISRKFVGLRIPDFQTHEGRLEIDSFALGVASDFPLEYNYNVESGIEYSMDTEVDIAFDNLPFSSKPSRLLREFNMEWSLANEDLVDMVESTLDRVSVNRKPIWAIPSHRAYPYQVYKCFVDGYDKEVVLNDGEKVFEISLQMRSSE